MLIVASIQIANFNICKYNNIVGPYQEAPDGVTLTDARPDQLKFSWSQIDSTCPTVQYQNTFDCGRCSLATPMSTLANCYDLHVSRTTRNCTFRVRSEICGFTGPFSDPVTVTLKGMLLSIIAIKGLV